jgi:hypothetical protein
MKKSALKVKARYGSHPVFVRSDRSLALPLYIAIHALYDEPPEISGLVGRFLGINAVRL